MGKKAAKATRKFAASGQLKKTIQQRRKHQDIRRKAERRKGTKKGGNDTGRVGDEGEDVEDDEEVEATSSKLLEFNLDTMEEDEDSAMEEDEDSAMEEDEDSAMEEDEDSEDDGEDDEGGEETESVPVLTKSTLQKWQKALLEQRSLRALRKLLIAFRSAVHMNEEDQVVAWSIDSSAVYNKLVTTALKYTPVVLAHHCPHKTLADGRFKGPTETTKWKTLQKMIMSYFHNVMHLLTQLTDNEMLVLALTETAKLVPYVTGSRKSVKVYLKTCLDLWSSAEDSVRIAAFLSVRKLASATDSSLMDLALKNTYLTLVCACKSTTAYSLPSINLMKNSASELYTIDHSSAYQHAFGYIRQLAILLRNSLKVKSKEAFKQVYNWQYVHCIDFWAIVLARACDRESETGRGSQSELRPLIYPLTQVALGATRLIPNARSYPYHLHLTRSLLHLTQHSRTYVPLAPVLLPMLVTPLTQSAKGGSLKPLDFETTLRAPQQYIKTRVYAEGLVEEAAFLLAEYLASPPVHGSIGYPEVIVPIVGAMRHAIKAAQKGKGKGKGKETGVVKALVERVEESGQWVEERRKGISFSPGKLAEVERWEASVRVEETPLGKYVRVLRKSREKKQRLIQKARDGEDEMLEN